MQFLNVIVTINLIKKIKIPISKGKIKKNAVFSEEEGFHQILNLPVPWSWTLQSPDFEKWGVLTEQSYKSYRTRRKPE